MDTRLHRRLHRPALGVALLLLAGGLWSAPAGAAVGTYEAENALLTGGAIVATDHTGYSGTGFVAGYGTVNASTTFTVTAASAGAHTIGLRYSNGPNPSAGTKTVSLYVNGTRIKQVSLADTGTWDTWAVNTEAVNLNAGANTIAYKHDTADIGHVNLDYLTLAAGPPGNANLALGRPATADSSCNAGEAPAKAVNGSVSGGNSDKWCSTGSSRWLQVDLGASSTVSRFVVKHAAAGGENGAWNTRDFNLQVSPNGTAWTTVATVTANTAATTTSDITAVTARYVRLNVTTPASDGNLAARIYEFEVYGSSSANRINLFNGTDLASWEHTNGTAASWPISAGAAQVCCGDIRTKQAFGDFKLHVEFWLPLYPSDVTGQARANSGVYLQERYEIQILDSYGDTTLADNECAGIYTKKAPDSNVATAPETWQTYDITFRAARYSGTTKTENARVTVVWNGTTVHNNVAIDGTTGGGDAEGPAAGRIRLQDHGNPVRYRNIWIEPMS